jgi:hypothetical protein
VLTNQKRLDGRRLQLTPMAIPIGLCLDCSHAKIICSDRGAVFYRCQLSDKDSRFPRYPRLPVETRAGYQQSEPAYLNDPDQQ